MYLSLHNKLGQKKKVMYSHLSSWYNQYNIVEVTKKYINSTKAKTDIGEGL